MEGEDATLEDSFAIINHVQAILDVTTTEFTAAAAAATDGKWTGLGADARQRLAQKSREEVHALQAAFARVRARMDADKGQGMSAAELEAAIAAAEAEATRLEGVAERAAALASAGTAQ